MRSVAATIAIASLVLLLNIVCGVIFPQYNVWNVVMTSVVIISNAVLILVALSILNDAFKISISFIFSFFCIVESILSVLSPQQVELNFYILGICLLLIFQLILLICAKFTQR